MEAGAFPLHALGAPACRIPGEVQEAVGHVALGLEM